MEEGSDKARTSLQWEGVGGYRCAQPRARAAFGDLGALWTTTKMVRKKGGSEHHALLCNFNGEQPVGSVHYEAIGVQHPKANVYTRRLLHPPTKKCRRTRDVRKALKSGTRQGVKT